MERHYKFQSNQSHLEQKEPWWWFYCAYKLSYRATVTKILLYQHKDRHPNQWTTTEDPDVNSLSRLSFDKDIKNIDRRKDGLVSNLHLGSWISACRRMKLDVSHSPCPISFPNGSKTLMDGLKFWKVKRTNCIDKNFLKETCLCRQMKSCMYVSWKS